MKINTIDDIYSLKIEDLDKSLKYMIVGVRKCGTQSLKKYLIDRGFDVECFENRFSMPKYYSTHDYSRIPIIVIRDIIERTWSDYQYFKDYDPPINPNGIDDSIEISKYKKYLKFWKDPILFTLGYLKELEGFPVENVNINNESPTKQDFDYMKSSLNYNTEQ